MRCARRTPARRSLIVTTVMCLSWPSFSGSADLESRVKKGFEAYTRSAEYLSEDEISPAWLTPFSAPSIEYMYALPEGRILVALGLRDEEPGDPLHGPLVLYNADTGKEIWRYQRNTSMDVAYAVLAHSPLLLLQRSDEAHTTYLGLSLDNGAEEWKVGASAPHTPLVLPDREMLILVNGNGEMAAHDLATGSQLWKQQSDVADDSRVTVEVVGDRIWIVGMGVGCHDLETGRLQWSAPEVGPMPQSTFPLVLEKGVVMGSGGRDVVFLGFDGAEHWRSRLPGTIGVLSADSNRAYIAYHSDDPTASGVVAVSLETGGALWKADLGGPIHSRLLIARGKLLGVFGSTLVMLDITTGERLAEAGLPVAGPRMADRLVAYPDQIVVAQAGSIGAYRWTDGDVVWSHRDPSATERIEDFISVMQMDLEIPYEAVKGAVEQMTSPVMDARGQWRIESALKVPRTTDSEGEPQFDIPFVAASDLTDSGFRADVERRVEQGLISPAWAETLLNTQVAWERSMAAANALATSMRTAMTLKEVADRMVWEALQKKWREMLPFQLTSAIQAQRRCIHGHYYLRSFERRGDQFGAGRWGFLLVDMRTGGWREITTFPYDEGYRLLRLNLHQVQFTRDGRRIVVRGTGLDPQLWTIGPNYGDLPDSKPTPALLAYDVEKIELRPAEQYVSRRKLLFGKPAEFKAEVASVDGRKTTLDDLISRIGQPRLVNMMYGRTATWTYAYEVGGIVYADELYCKLNKRKVATSCKYICYPSELVSVDPYTRECIRPD